MPINHEGAPANHEEKQPSQWEQIAAGEKDVEERAWHRKIGSKILALAGMQNRSYVQRSFERGRRRGEKYESNNPNERRTEAYISRLDKIIEKHGREAEKRLWEASISEIKLLSPENITDATWHSIQQEHRDRGIKLGDTPKLRREMAKEYSSVQKEDLEGYAEYFSSQDCPYPTWFKVLAWDGLTRLSRITKIGKDGFPVFQARDEHTAAGFPKLNPAALAKVYEDITGYFGLPTEKKTEGIDEITYKLVKSGSFAKLYSYEMSRLIKPPEVPDRTEDIRGGWVEYDISQVKQISQAAEGTPWCIVSPAVARNYLEDGSYGGGGSYHEGKVGEKARFILFHLTDPETGLPAKQACASIRLGPDGKVAEISGILDGSKQRLHDSLLPIVKEKVDQLPGGEQFYQAFLDNEKLIHLDEKFKKHEPFSDEELDFIFETRYGISQLNPYNRDFRIEELKDVPTLLKNGANATKLAEILKPEDIAYYLPELIEAKVEIDVDDLISKLKPDDLYTYLNNLIKAGGSIDIIVKKMDAKDVVFSLHKLLEAGAKIDIDDLVKKLEPGEIVCNITKLLEAGAKIDIDDLVKKLEPGEIVNNLFELRTAGVDIEKLVIERLSPQEIEFWLQTIIMNGVSEYALKKAGVLG